MPNSEFEKRVQQQMDEFKFMPSEQVWEKVESQIREKKKRRAFFLWLPLLLLLIAGGSYYFFTNPFRKMAESGNLAQQPLNADNNQPEKKSTVNSDKIATPIQTQPALNAENGAMDRIRSKVDTLDAAQSSNEKGVAAGKQINKTVLLPPPAAGPATIEGGSNIRFEKKQHNGKAGLTPGNRILAGNNTFNKISHSHKLPGLKKTRLGTRAETAGDRTANNKMVQPSNPQYPADIINGDEKIIGHFVFPIAKENTGIPPYGVSENIGLSRLLNYSNPKYPAINRDSLLVATNSKQIPVAKNKWELGMAASGGISNFSSGLSGLINAAPAATALSYTGFRYRGPLQNVKSVASDFRSGIAFSAGAVARRNLSHQFSFFSGIRYNYYSSRISVGAKYNPALQFNYGISAPQASSGYYTSGNASNYNYTNQYHYLEIPLAIEMRLGKKSLFAVHTGAAIGELLGSNALHYDATNGFYFKDNSMFAKTQLGIFAGLTYRITAKHKISMMVGPTVQYGVSNLFKNNVYSSGHLISAGIGFTLFFHKNK